MAFFSIGSFLAIFIVGIIWATRPVNRREAQQHGTTQIPGTKFSDDLGR